MTEKEWNETAMKVLNSPKTEPKSPKLKFQQYSSSFKVSKKALEDEFAKVVADPYLTDKNDWFLISSKIPKPQPLFLSVLSEIDSFGTIPEKRCPRCHRPETEDCTQ